MYIYTYVHIYCKCNVLYTIIHISVNFCPAHIDVTCAGAFKRGQTFVTDV